MLTQLWDEFKHFWGVIRCYCPSLAITIFGGQISKVDSLGRCSREVESWLGLFEQFFRFDKWNACRVQAAAICDSRLK